MSKIIVMAFPPRNIVGCFLKKSLTKGGVTGTPGPPLATPLYSVKQSYSEVLFELSNNSQAVLYFGSSFFFLFEEEKSYSTILDKTVETLLQYLIINC